MQNAEHVTHCCISVLVHNVQCQTTAAFLTLYFTGGKKAVVWDKSVAVSISFLHEAPGLRRHAEVSVCLSFSNKATVVCAAPLGMSPHRSVFPSCPHFLPHQALEDYIMLCFREKCLKAFGLLGIFRYLGVGEFMCAFMCVCAHHCVCFNSLQRVYFAGGYLGTGWGCMTQDCVPREHTQSTSYFIISGRSSWHICQTQTYWLAPFYRRK